MPPRKAAKRSRTTAAVARNIATEGNNAVLAPPQKPVPVLDIASYPHILSLILDYSTSSTLSTLLRCSQSLFKSAVGRLWRNLRVTPEQLVRMVEVGWAPSKRGATSGRLGRGFSYYLRAALGHTRTLHLHGWTMFKTLPEIPRGCLGGLRNTVIYHSGGVGMRLQRPLSALSATHLYIRVSDSSVFFGGPGVSPRIALYDVPKLVEQVTLLVPLACTLVGAPSLYIPHISALKASEVVLLPWGRSHTQLRPTMVESWTTNPSGLAYPVNNLPRTLVGAEYCGLEGDQKRLVMGARMGARVSAAEHLFFKTFADWYDQLEPDSVFTLVEGASHWRDDIDLCRNNLEATAARIEAMSDEQEQACEVMIDDVIGSITDADRMRQREALASIQAKRAEIAAAKDELRLAGDHLAARIREGPPGMRRMAM